MIRVGEFFFSASVRGGRSGCLGILGVIPRCKHLHPIDSSPSVRRFSTLSWDVAGERSGPEATAGCPETPWITVSGGGVGGRGGTSITALTSGQKARQRRKGRRWWRENERRRREDEDGDTSPTQTSRRRLRATLTACFRLHGKAATVTTDGGAAVIRAEKKLYLLRCFRRPVVGVAVIKCHFSRESQSASEKPAHTHIHTHTYIHTQAHAADVCRLFLWAKMEK